MSVRRARHARLICLTIRTIRKHIMIETTPDAYQDIRDAVRYLCGEFSDEYFRKIDEARAYPEAFVDALTKAGWLAALIPQEYGGSGLGLTEASVIMEEINRAGGNSGACHGQMYNMGTLLRHGSEAQKQKYLPKIATGELRLQSMGVTEPSTGTDTTRIKTTAVKKGDRYFLTGETVTGWRLAGIAVVLGGVALGIFTSGRRVK